MPRLVPMTLETVPIPADDAVGIRTWLAEIAMNDRAAVLDVRQIRALLAEHAKIQADMNHLAGIAYAHNPTRGSDD